MTFPEWIVYFEKKSGAKHEEDPRFHLEFDEQRGFLYWLQQGDCIVTDEGAGDGRYWLAFLLQKAKELNCRKIKHVTYRNPKAWARYLGTGTVIQTLTDVHGKTMYIMEMEV